MIQLTRRSALLGPTAAAFAAATASMPARAGAPAAGKQAPGFYRYKVGDIEVNVITDGVVRDVAGVLETNLPVWCRGVAAPPSVAGLTFVAWQEPIGCGGVAVFPNDIIVVDQDGAVLIPAGLLDAVLAEAPEQERMEAWIMTKVDEGASLPGLYPMNAETKALYEASKEK